MFLVNTLSTDANGCFEVVNHFHDKFGVMSYKLDLEYMSWALAIWLIDMDAPGMPNMAQGMFMQYVSWLFSGTGHFRNGQP